MHHVFAGMNEEASEYKLEPREKFTTPKLALTYSCEGLGGASRNFHRWARMGMVHNCDKPRDILLTAGKEYTLINQRTGNGSDDEGFRSNGW